MKKPMYSTAIRMNQRIFKSIVTSGV